MEKTNWCGDVWGLEGLDFGVIVFGVISDISFISQVKMNSCLFVRRGCYVGFIGVRITCVNSRLNRKLQGSCIDSKTKCILQSSSRWGVVQPFQLMSQLGLTWRFPNRGWFLKK